MPHGEYDLIVFVASLHHLDSRTALRRARTMLRPGGELLVVGLTANGSPSDWILSGLALPLIRLLSRVHGESHDIGVVTAEPKESLREIRELVGTELPGARIRRGLYYRDLLRWRNDGHPR
jgi:hypothetical protein